MGSLNEYKRRSLIPLVGLLLASYYLFVFLPLAKRAEDLDAPLRKGWRKLAGSVDQTNATTIDFVLVTNQLNETRHALAVLEDARRKAAARLQLPAELRARMNSRFELVEYQNERSKQVDDLDKQAKALQIALEPVILQGYPEHTTEISEPSLLWPALAFTHDLLNTALRCKVAALHSLKVPLGGNPLSARVPDHMDEIPVEIELTAPAANAAQFIQSLPLRAAEIKAAGLPDAEPEKAALFIERLIVRKQNPEKLDEVRVWLRVIGFVLRE